MMMMMMTIQDGVGVDGVAETWLTLVLLKDLLRICYVYIYQLLLLSKCLDGWVIMIVNLFTYLFIMQQCNATAI